MDNEITLHRILIIDDDNDYRKLLLTWLDHAFEGTEIVEFDPQKQGVPGDDFDWSAFAVLLLDYDLNLPAATGLDILHANHNNNRFPATVMLTSHGSEDVAVRALKSGVTDYLRKERLDKEQLRAAVEFALARHASNRERLGTLQEAVQVAQDESRRVIASFKSKYAKLRELEVKRVKAERDRIGQELQKKEEVLRQIEQERRKAEDLKNFLEAEMDKLKKSTPVAGTDDSINEQLEITQEQLALTSNGINRIEQDFKQVAAEVNKTRWKQEQGFIIQQQLENDMKNFKDELAQHEEQLSVFNSRIKEHLGILEDIAQSKKEIAKKHDKSLLDEVTSMLDKED